VASDKRVVLPVPRNFAQLTHDERKAWADQMATLLQEQLAGERNEDAE